MNSPVESSMRTRSRCDGRVYFTILAVIPFWLAACDSSDGPPTKTVANVLPDKPVASYFKDISLASGLSFVHKNGATAGHFMPEIMSAGCALFDYDNDGDLDVLLLQGGRINDTTEPLFGLADGPQSARLFRNQLIPDGSLRFEDVTAASGLQTNTYGMGVGVGDIDNDGDMDVYITDLTVNALYLNNGDGTFTSASPTIDASNSGWSTSASFLDYDLDGALDLYVARYVKVDLKNARVCGGASGRRDYCTPEVYWPLPDLLFKGDGGGQLTLIDGWRASALAPQTGLGVVAADFNSDGYPDIYVGNDKKPNMLWLNLGNGTFEDTAVMSGTAYDVNGKAEASMGVTSADVDADGDQDLFVSHLKGETNTLYLNYGDANFLDATIDFRLSSPSIPSTGFGTRWFDFDNDGDLDLFVANGAVMVEPAQMDVVSFPYNQANQFFENTGELTYVDASIKAGVGKRKMEISRGAAFGDVDNDGDVDILVSNNNGPVRLLRNDRDNDHHWLSVRLRGVEVNRDGVGARIGIERPDKPTLWRRVGTDGSYLSASDIRVHFGLGESAEMVGVMVIWPGGAKERFADVTTRQFITLEQGGGVSLPD